MDICLTVGPNHEIGPAAISRFSQDNFLEPNYEVGYDKSCNLNTE